MGRPARPPHQLTLRNHHGRAVCTFRGRVHQFGPWEPPSPGHPDGKPSDEALRAFQSQQRAWAEGAPAEQPADAGGPATLAAVWAAWMRTPHAPRDRRGDNRRAAVELFGTSTAPGPFRDTRAGDLTAAAVLAWQDGLCARGLSRYSVLRLVGFLRRCLAWGRVAGLVPAAVVADVALVDPPPRSSTPRPKVRRGVTWEQVEAVCARLRSRAAGDFLRVLWFSGARPSELARVTVGMVQRAGVVRPDKGEPVTLGRCWAANLGRESKTGDERCLFFGPECQRVIAPYLARRPASEPLFPTRDGRAYTYRALTDAISRACGKYKGKRREKGKEVGEGWTVYSLRHAAGQRVQAHYSGLVPGAGWLAAQAYLGHRARGVTGGYTGSDWVTAERVAAELG